MNCLHQIWRKNQQMSLRLQGNNTKWIAARKERKYLIQNWWNRKKLINKHFGRLDSRVVFTLNFEHRYATPWAVSLSLGDVKLFFGPKHNIYALFMILFDLFDLILLFVMWIVKQKIEKKRNLFLKTYLGKILAFRGWNLHKNVNTKIIALRVRHHWKQVWAGTQPLFCDPGSGYCP